MGSMDFSPFNLNDFEVSTGDIRPVHVLKLIQILSLFNSENFDICVILLHFIMRTNLDRRVKKIVYLNLKLSENQDIF